MKDLNKLKIGFKNLNVKINELGSLWGHIFANNYQAREDFNVLQEQVTRGINLIETDKNEHLNKNLCKLLRDLNAKCTAIIRKIDNAKGVFNLDEPARSELLNVLRGLESLSSLSNYEVSSIYSPDELHGNKKIYQQQKIMEINNEFQISLQEIKKLASQLNTADSVSCFISYAWPLETKPYEKWMQKFLEQFVSHLRKLGIITYFDRNDSRYGENSNKFMDKIATAHFIIIIGSESLLDKYQYGAGTSSVCREINTIRVRRLENENCIIPLILSGSMETAVPIEFERFVVTETFVDTGYAKVFFDLVRRLYSLGHEHESYNQIISPLKENYPEWFKPLVGSSYSNIIKTLSSNNSLGQEKSNKEKNSNIINFREAMSFNDNVSCSKKHLSSDRGTSFPVCNKTTTVRGKIKINSTLPLGTSVQVEAEINKPNKPWCSIS